MMQQLVPKYKFKVLPKISLCSLSSHNFEEVKYIMPVQTFIYPDNLCFHGFGFLGFLLSLTHFPVVHSVYNVTKLSTFLHVFLCPKDGSPLVRAFS